MKKFSITSENVYNSCKTVCHLCWFGANDWLPFRCMFDPDIMTDYALIQRENPPTSALTL